MPRIFVAAEVPRAVRATLAGLRSDKLTARWIEAKNLHITLRFIGRVDAETCSSVATALAGVGAASFEVKPLGLVVFPSWRRPRVLAVAIKPDAEMEQLQTSVENVLQESDIPPETKPFRPHITVARLKRALPEHVRTFVRENDNFELEPYAVDRVVLYESVLSPTGANYIPLARYRLH